MGPEGLYIDHVILGVVDIEEAVARLRRDHGLGAVPGGVHRGGTTNRIVPLAPPTYLELLGIGDTTRADAAWLQQALDGRDRLLWWVLGTGDLDESARRRGLPVQSGEMAMADGSTLTFRTAGMPLYPRPFFIDYAAPAEVRTDHWRRLYAEAAHDCAPGAFTFVEVLDPPELTEAWLGDHGLPVRHRAAPGAGIVAAGIASDAGEIVVC